ncbi:hypothetical protein HELRODRAFT_164478 [Helobdella robusta]|uniref:Chloride channel CLIC-like protein 1 n=1 Tax=Helobdella robusta TaxID=6412 RepID=T1EVH3_HELRO|nr:hypothetical protein HELRODRAFT_164478 [Helobdella robusta]ESN94613.1 hypothetical protein HELRODRAFT_164478 [Helobdella robusta]
MDCMDIRKELAICNKKSRSATEHCDANKDLTTVNVFFKRFIRTVSNNFCSQSINADDGYHQIDLTLTDLQCSYLKESLEERHSIVTLQEVHYILNNMTWVPRVTLPGLVGVWCDYLQENIKVVFMISASAAMLSNIIYILSKLRLSFYRLIFITTALLFLISVPWTWWYLYKKALASKMAALSKSPPDSCSPQKMSFFDTLYSYFHFTENECLKYYEALQVDALWEALAVTFAKFFLEPFEYLGEAIKKLFLSALNGVPFFLQPFILVFIVFMIALIVFVCSGYRFRSLLFNIEPSRAISISSAHNAQLKGLQDEIDKLEKKIKDLRLQEGRMIEDGSGDAKVHNALPISAAPALSSSSSSVSETPSPSALSVQAQVTLPSITADFRLS